jgi:hypothetical protein
MPLSARRAKARKLKAIAYHLSDIIMTKAQALRAQQPHLSRNDAIARVVTDMATQAR